jgi:hypothetical protein
VSTVGAGVQVVDTLMVSQQLITNRMLGSTLTLTGSGTQRPTYEAALCVKGGAQFDGLTEHGLLRVRGQSCMRGPLAVSNIYGPVTVGADPAVPYPDAVQLVVQGTAETAAVVTDELTAGFVSADAANIAVLNSTVLTVDGVLAGPFAPAEITALISNAVGVVTIVADGSTYTFTSVAVGPSTHLVGVTSDLFSLLPASSVSVYLPRYLGGAVTAPGTIAKVLPAGNLLTVEVTGMTTSVYFDPETDMAGDVEDSPLPNTPLVVGYANSATGILGFTTASVEDGFGQMFSQFTSVHLRPGCTLPRGALGGPIVNYRGKLVAVVQYGNLDAFDAYGSLTYSTVTGGIKARFIRYFLGSSAASPVPLPASTVTTTGPIRFTERASTPSLLSGGVSLAPGSTTAATQALNIQTTDFAEVLGCFGVNFPNLPEIFLATAGGAPATYTLTTAVQNGVASSAPDFALDTTYWKNGNLPNAYIPVQNSLYTTSMTYVAYTSGALAIGAIPFQLYGLANTQTQFGVSTYGNVSDTNIHSGVIIAWGDAGALQVYFDGIGTGRAGLTNTISQAWTAFAGGETGNVLGVGGVVGSSFVFYDALPFTTGNTADFSVSRTTPTQLTVEIGGFNQTFSYVPLFNIMDITKNGGSCGLVNTAAGDQFTYTTGATTTVTNPTSIATPTKLYM